jgi:hypothetical protein
MVKQEIIEGEVIESHEEEKEREHFARIINAFKCYK